MPVNKKKNAYTYYVEERCRGTGRHYSQSFHLYSQDWEALAAETKEKYFDMAARERFGSDEAKEDSGTSTASSGWSSDRDAAVWAKNTSSSSFSRPTMKEIIMDVNHNVGEFVEKKQGGGKVNDVATPLLEDLAGDFLQAVKDEYPDISHSMLDIVRVISCVPLSPNDNNLTPINRPIEIAVEGFKMGMGHIGKTLFHQFVDPGHLAPGAQMAVSSARRKYHQIPAARYINIEKSCRTFHENFKLSGDYYMIYHDLLKAAGWKESGRTKPIPLLTGDVDPASTWACLEWLYQQAIAQADRDGLPDLPRLILSTVWDFVGHVMGKMRLETMENLQYVRNTFTQLRYHHQVVLRCPFHQDVDSELCARGTANDKIYSTFDVLRWFGFTLPEEEPFIPPTGNRH